MQTKSVCKSFNISPVLQLLVSQTVFSSRYYRMLCIKTLATLVVKSATLTRFRSKRRKKQFSDIKLQGNKRDRRGNVSCPSVSITTLPSRRCSLGPDPA